MRTLNIDKMRHAQERSHALAEMRERQSRRDAMTPEHRAFHEQHADWPCGVCIGQIGRNLSISIAAMQANRDVRRAAMQAKL